MRKGIRIKASLFIFIWLVIMAHNIIPHNHQAVDICLSPGHSHTGVSLNAEFHAQGDNRGICHISGLLFHKLSQENLFIENNIYDYSFSILRKKLIIDNTQHFFYSNSYYTSVSLRAPPAA